MSSPQPSYSVVREFRWEAAHRIREHYVGKCNHNHGHSWVARICVRLKPEAELDEVGFVTDFDNLCAVGAWIAEHWDHATLVSKNDTAMLNFLEENEQRHYVIDGNPTSEHLCRILFDVASARLNDPRIEVAEVWVQETCTSEACFKLQ